MIVLVELFVAIVIIINIIKVFKNLLLFLIRRDVLPVVVVVGVVYIFVFVVDIDYSVLFGDYIWPIIVFCFKLVVGVFLACLAYVIASRMSKNNQNRFSGINQKLGYKDISLLMRYFKCVSLMITLCKNARKFK